MRETGELCSRAGECVLGLRGKNADKVSRGRQVVDEIDGLTGPHRQRGQIASCHAVPVGPLGIGVCGEFGFPAPPLIEERVAEGAARIFARPR